MSRLDISRRNSNSSRSLYVRSVLSRLDFKSFQRVVWLWLGANGYQHMRTLGRSKRRGRGSAGPDFLVQVGENGIDVAVQIRHWRSPLSKRAVDELRGILLRDHIPAGMIVSSSTVSRAARIAAADFSGRPIRILGIDRLAESMVAFDLGSESFFRSLGALSLGLPRTRSRSHQVARAADFDSSPDGPKPDRTAWILTALILLSLLWLLKGLV